MVRSITIIGPDGCVAPKFIGLSQRGWCLSHCWGVYWCCLSPNFVVEWQTAVKQGCPPSPAVALNPPRVPHPHLNTSGLWRMTVAATRTQIVQTQTLSWMTWPAGASAAPPQLPPPTLQCPPVPGVWEVHRGLKVARGLRSLWLPVFLYRMWPTTGQRTWSKRVMCLPDESKADCFSHPSFVTAFGSSMLTNRSFSLLVSCLRFHMQHVFVSSLWILWAWRSGFIWQHN